MSQARNSITSKSARDRLVPRREPYWSRVVKGGYVGYRKSRYAGTWVARWRTAGSKQLTHALDLQGVDPADQYDEATRRAQQWFDSLGNQHKTGYTVADAIEDYCKHREINNSKASALDARQRLEKHVVPRLGDLQLVKLTKQQVTDWRDNLVRVSDDPEDVRKSKDGANRLLSYFKAALNLAYQREIIATDRAWRTVRAFKDVGQARQVILTDDQIKRLREHTDGPFGELVESALLTGARYGELIAARVEDLDAHNGALRLSGKTGSRDCYLSGAALAHFKRLASSKLPAAYLHTKEDGSAWGKSHQHRHVQAAVKSARLPRATTFYALRHTHISRALLAGVNAQVVAENTGTSVRMIEKYYGKFMKADRRAMFDRVDFG